MNAIRRTLALSAFAVVAAAANAGVSFNVLSTSSSYGSAGSLLTFDGATAGLYNGAPSKVVQYTYIATATGGDQITGVTLGADYALWNNAAFFGGQTFKTLDDSTTLGSFNFTETGTSTLQTGTGVTSDFTFAAPVSAFKATATFFLVGDTSLTPISLASITNVTQNVHTAPVPEPASMAALAMGLVGIAARRRKK